jgi:hypothetical protein
MVSTSPYLSSQLMYYEAIRDLSLSHIIVLAQPSHWRNEEVEARRIFQHSVPINQKARISRANNTRFGAFSVLEVF